MLEPGSKLTIRVHESLSQRRRRTQAKVIIHAVFHTTQQGASNFEISSKIKPKSKNKSARFSIFGLRMIPSPEKNVSNSKNFFFLPQRRGHQRWCLNRVGSTCGFHSNAIADRSDDLSDSITYTCRSIYCNFGRLKVMY